LISLSIYCQKYMLIIIFYIRFTIYSINGSPPRMEKLDNVPKDYGRKVFRSYNIQESLKMC
jgi:hypothetical protein